LGGFESGVLLVNLDDRLGEFSVGQRVGIDRSQVLDGDPEVIEHTFSLPTRMRENH